MPLKLRFLGTSACIPEPGGDSPSFIVGDGCLFDLGWHAPDNLKSAGFDLGKVKTVFLTHLHHDHYMALPQLIFSIVMTGVYPLSELKLIGPEEDIGRLTEKAADFLELDRFFPEAGRPNVIPVSGDERIAYEDDDIRVESRRSVHPVAGLWYRLTDKHGGKVLAITGDTAYDDAQAGFFRGADAIISETALALSRQDGSRFGHSSVYDAVRVADDAGIPRMFCIHLSPERLKSAVDAARKLRKPPFTAEYPEYGRDFEI